jgi:hypothetical protein
MQWIGRFVEELKSDKWVLPALKQIREICQLFPEAPQNFPHTQRAPHMYYRNNVIGQLQNQHSIVMLVSQNLHQYMVRARQYATGQSMMMIYAIIIRNQMINRYLLSHMEKLLVAHVECLLWSRHGSNPVLISLCPTLYQINYPARPKINIVKWWLRCYLGRE